jgi:hypothetical protein
MFLLMPLKYNMSRCRILLFFTALSFLPVLAMAQMRDTLDIAMEPVSELQIEEVYRHSPHKASMYAAIFPGLGQVYNKKYWKLPILYGGIGGMAYGIHFNTKYYNLYRSAYRDFLIRDPGNTSYEKVLPSTLTIEDVHGSYADWFQRALQSKRRYYKRYRDMTYIGMFAIYVISIIDASVDAHFYDFDISDDLSFRLEPAILSPFPDSGSAFGLQMQFRF